MLSSSFTFIFASAVLLLVPPPVRGQDELEALQNPLFFLGAAGTFLQGRCWNFYSQSNQLPDMPNRDDYTDIIFPPSDVINQIPRKVDGPLQMQGLFYLDIPGDVPEVVTFFDTNEGGGLGQPLQGNPPMRRQRIMSERNWAASYSAENADLITGSNDLVVVWEVRDGTAADPRVFDLWVDVRLPIVPCTRTSTKMCGAPFPLWSMHLQNVPGVNPHPVYTESYVWRRESTFDGKSSSYEAIQLVNGAGNILQPTWTNFLNKANPVGNMFTKVLNTPAAPSTCGAPPVWCFFPFPFVC